MLNIFKKIALIVIIFFSCITAHAQTYNLITKGDMEDGTWTTNPLNTDLAITFDSGSGIGGSKSLKAVTSSMGGSSYYIIRCDEGFSLTQGDKITVSFWAKGSVADMRLQPWGQENSESWQNYGDAYLTTSWVKYQFTVTTTTDSDSGFNVKFRGYSTGTVYIDNVQIGPVDYEDVQQSGIYEVTVSQNSMLWPLNVFRNTCPAFSLGYEDMLAKDEGPLDLFANRSINWTKLSFSGSMVVHVKVTDTDKVPVSGETVRILPSRYGITSSTVGNVVTFTITEPGQYSVEIGDNGYKNGLMIFADPTETDVPSQADPDYLVLYEATSNDIASISEDYTGVYFMRGVHDIAVFNIPSHIKDIYFEDGSWVYGALKMDGDPNVRIYGRGVLSSKNFNYRETHCVEAINNSDSITIEGLVVADPKYFAIRLIGTDNIVNYAKVIGGWVYNCDGIAAYANSSVSKCFIWANDDAIKAYRDGTTWSDIVVWQLNNGGIIQMSWGGAPGGSTNENVTISRVDVLRADWNVDRFNVGLLNCVGNHYAQDNTKHETISNWIIENVVTESDIPLVFNISPDPFTHCHINNVTFRNWDVNMDMGLGFENRIMGNVVEDYISGLVIDSVKFNGGWMTNENRISTGEMDSGGWTGVPNGTNHVLTLGSTYGTGGGWGLRSVTTSMNGQPHYTNVCNDEFTVSTGEAITISYWARATAAGKLLTPFIQSVGTSADITYFTQVALTTNFQRYHSTFTVPDGHTDYKVKFRGFETAWIYLDKVQVGRKDWITLTDLTKSYLDTPTFIPDLKSAQIITTIENTFKAFGFYPNPVKATLYIPGNKIGTQYMVFSMLGSLVLKGAGNRVNVAALLPGTYFLATEGTKPAKFIKE